MFVPIWIPFPVASVITLPSKSNTLFVILSEAPSILNELSSALTVPLCVPIEVPVIVFAV